ncbi:MAG: glycosyltransferase family 4 protein [Planctomycetota bacterium]
MRIAFVLDHYTPGKGGLERWVADLADHLRASGHEPHLVSGDRAVSDPRFAHHPIRSRGLTRAGRDRDFAERARLFTKAEAFDRVLGFRHLLACDVYVPHGGSVTEAFAAHREAKGGIALPRGRVRNFLRLERELLTGPDVPGVQAVSDMVRGDLLRHYPGLEGRIEVVPNGVDLERFAPGGRDAARDRLGIDGRAALFVAGNPRLKGWRFAREAFTRLRDDGALPHLLVAGGDPGSLPAGARYLGRLEDPAEAIRAADVLLQPTYYDPFPLTTLEALACGTPVATTARNGAVPHLGESGAVRACAHPSDVAGLARHAADLLAESPRAAARRAAEDFPLGTCLEQTAARISDRPTER